MKTRASNADLRRTLAARAASLKRERVPHESVWTSIRQNFEPAFGRSINQLTATNADRNAPLDDSAIINSHPRTALSRLGAGMQGGITSPASQWFRLTISDGKTSERTDVREWLDEVTKTIAAAFAKSNIYTTLHQTYLHLGAFGTSAALIIPDDEADMHAIFLDAGSYWIAADRRGGISTLLRAFQFTASQIRDEFGAEAAAADTAVSNALAANRHEDTFLIWHLIQPNDGSFEVPDTHPFVSIYWRDASSEDTILAVRSFSYCPILAPRWQILNGSYGFGPGHVSLSDAKELQRLETDSLKSLALLNDPPLTAPASMRQDAVNTFPGGITYYDPLGSDKPAITPLYEVRPNIEHLEAKIRQVESRIDRNFFNDLFAMMLNLNQRPKQMTAREVNELAAEKMALLGPVLTRLNTDLLDRLVDAAFAILLESNRFPAPPEILLGQPLNVQYVSILHTEQQSVSRLGSMIRLCDFIAMIAPASPDCVDKIDADQAIDEASQVLAVPARVIRSDAAVAKIREARAAQQQAAMQAEAASRLIPGAAKAARDLGETSAAPGSLLSNLTGAAQ